MNIMSLKYVSLMGLALLLPAAGFAQSVFFIEAEDFDYGRGQHPPETDLMPYYGGVYFNYSGVAERGVDFDRSDFVLFYEDYRYGEFPNVPVLMVPPAPDRQASWVRGDWILDLNFKLGYLSEGGESWFNYTRNFPAGQYSVYAALSHGDSTPGALRGALSRVTAGVGGASQRVQELGKFRGDGTGSWNRFLLVPLMDNGAKVKVDLAGLTTLRYTSGSGDFDYLVFRPEGLPEAAITPGATETAVGSTVVLNANPTGSGPFSLQWRKDGQEIPGATGATLTLSSVTYADAGFYTVEARNGAGIWGATPATVKVYCPLQIPTIVAADQPCPGAGMYLPEPQWPREQYYRFHGTSGQALYFESLGSEEESWVSAQISLSSPGGTVLFSTGFGFWWEGLPAGTVLLPETGDYTLTVLVPANQAGGRYSFRLDNPGNVQSFPIHVGDSVPESQPGEGAGNLDNSSSVDIFELTTDAPVDVYFSDRSSIGQSFTPQWALLDPDGQLVFLWPRGWDSGYWAPHSYRLSKQGTYRILVSSGITTSSGTASSYAFQLLPTTVQQFRFDLGNRISPDQPSAGAGRLEGPGSLDSYWFKAKAGQTIYVSELAEMSQQLGAVYQLAGPSGQTLYVDFIDDALSWWLQPTAVVTLPETGVYHLSVWPLLDAGSPDAIGTYSMEILPSVGVQNFIIEPGQVIDQNWRGKWTKGAGYLDPNGATDLFTFQLKSDSLVTLVDLGSEGNRIEATLGTLGDGTQPMERLFKDLLDGVSASSVTLPAGIYQVRISASGEDPSISGRYSFSVKLN